MTPEEYRARLKSVETPHGTFAYLDVGEGPATVFVHGLLMSGYFWHDVIDALAPERRCIAYNLPAHGGSEVPDDQALTLPANAQMLAGFCDALGLDELDLVANDTGGAIAQAFTVADPGRVRTLSLTNCEANDWMPSKSELGQLLEKLASSGDLAPMLKSFHDDPDNARRSSFVATLQWPERIDDDQARAIGGPHQATIEAARRLERFATSLRPEDLVAIEPGLRELPVPAIAVWGTADEIFPLELAHWLADTIPGLDEVVEIDGGKLFWPIERGAELVPHLRRLWSRPGQGASSASVPSSQPRSSASAG
jgi:pimeloyl-ACP methyl ester carboxylesterase